MQDNKVMIENFKEELKKEQDQDFIDVATEKFHSMEDNTQVNDDEKKLRFAKLNMPASVVDFLMDHYGFFDLVELNTLSLYILKTLGHMENDGFKFAVYKQVEGKVESSYQLDIHDLIGKFRIQIANSMNQNKPSVPEIKVEHKEENEKDNV